MGQGVVFRLGPRVNATPISIHSLLVLPSKHEKRSESISPPFLRQNQESQRAPREAAVRHRFPNSHLCIPPTLLPRFSPPSSPKLSLRRLRQRMRLDMTGLRKKVGNSEKFMVSIGERLTRRDQYDRSGCHTHALAAAGGIHLGYHTHYVVDGGKHRIILSVLVVPGEVMDNQPMLDLFWYVYFRWHVRPKQLTGDTKYATIENIKAIEDAHIRAYVPLPDWEHMTPYYGSSQFTGFCRT